MTSKELIEIKKYQKEFKKLFNRKLVIDFESMNGIVKVSNSVIKKVLFNKKEADKILNNLCKEHNADINIIKDNKVRLAFKYPNEVKVIYLYIKECIKQKWDKNNFMPHINRDRTDAYYYIKKYKK